MRSDRQVAAQLIVAVCALLGSACTEDSTSVVSPGESTTDIDRSLAGENTAGVNLAGANLAGSNLGGNNLGANNLAGTNLAGANLGGTNLGGANLGGANLAGANLGGTNLAGNNLAGANLGGSNLAGSNLAATNLAGSNLAGANLAATNLGGTNLGGTNLAGLYAGHGTPIANATRSGALGAPTDTAFAAPNTIGTNLHNVGASTLRMLRSGEDVYDKSKSNVALGVGSSAFAQLVKDNAPTTGSLTMYAALGKLPWGFADLGYLPQLPLYASNDTFGQPAFQSSTAAGSWAGTIGSRFYHLGWHTFAAEAGRKYIVSTDAAPGEWEGAPQVGFYDDGTGTRVCPNNSVDGRVTTCSPTTTGIATIMEYASADGARWNYRVSEVLSVPANGARTFSFPTVAGRLYRAAALTDVGACAAAAVTAISGACACAGSETGCSCTATSTGTATLSVNRAACAGAVDYGVLGPTGDTGLDAWELVVWGPARYSVFVLVAPREATFPAIAGFIKAIWRWNAAPTMTLKLGQIGGGEPVQTHTGMMGMYDPVVLGSVGRKEYLAGLLAFTSATINNQSVQVDFASWVQRSDGSPRILGNVAGTPQALEGVYGTYERDGLVHVYFQPLDTSVITDYGDDTGDLRDLTAGCPKAPVRCAGLKALSGTTGNEQFGIPLGKCDRFIHWSTEKLGLQLTGGESWTASAAVSPKVAKYNDYMRTTRATAPLMVLPPDAPTSYPVLSETYVHLNQAPATDWCSTGVVNLAKNSSFETKQTLGVGGHITDVVTGTAATGAMTVYGPYPVKAGTSFTSSVLEKFTGNPDLFVKWGALPTTSSYDCASRNTAQQQDVCALTVPTAVTQAYVMVFGATSSNFEVTTDYSTSAGTTNPDILTTAAAGVTYSQTNEHPPALWFPSYSGSKALKIANTSTVNIGKLKTAPTAIAVTAGKRYTASVIRYGANYDAAGTRIAPANGTLRLNFLSASGGAVGSATSAPIVYGYDPVYDWWAPSSVAATAPSGAAFLQVEIQAGKGTFWFDHLQVTETTGLVGFWSFNEVSGYWDGKRAADWSGTGNDGVSIGGAATTADARSNMLDLRYTPTFATPLSNADLAGQVVVPSSSSLMLSGKLTLSAWFWHAAGDPFYGTFEEPRAALISKVNPTNYAGSLAYSLRFSATGGLIFAAKVGGVVKETPVAPAPASGYTLSASGLYRYNWHHVAGVYTGAALLLYVDGMLVSQVAASGAVTTNTEPLRMGGAFYGVMEDVRVYNRALSATEIVGLSSLNPEVGPY